METPVSESEWEAIVHDQRYVQKFGRKPGLSPKGRAAIIAGAAAVLITIPILFKTLSHKPTETAQTVTPVATETPVQTPVTPTATTTAPKATSDSQPQVSSQTTSKQNVSTAKGAIAHEQSTLVAITEARSMPSVPTITKEQTVAIPAPQLSVNSTPVRPAATPTASKTKAESPVIPSQTEASWEEAPKSDSDAEEPVMETDQFFVPSAFTPNGDGLNDLLLVKANFEPRNFEMTVFNRNGERLFQTRDMNIGWDGRLHGSILPSGVYVYIIKYKDRTGNEQQKQGQILLIP